MVLGSVVVRIFVVLICFTYCIGVIQSDKSFNYMLAFV
jgi:hypothetical protein